MAELAPSGPDNHFQLGFAGDTFNTAWYLAQIDPGIEVAYLSAVGDDLISHQMLAFMQSGGVDTSHVTQRLGETVGLYMIHLEAGERSFSYWRGQSAARHLASDAPALARAVDEADLIYVSGITLAILEPDARIRLLAALQRGREVGKSIAFDPNLRPRLWSSSHDMLETVTTAANHADIVLPSFEDEAAWFGDTDPEATLDRYTRAGAKRVVVKDSQQDVHYVDAASRGRVAVTPAETVVDTTAAGDSFNAAVLACLLSGRSTVSSIEDGARLARHVIGHRGALVPVREMTS